MIEGGKCPGCGQIFAPFVKKCDTCVGTKINQFINPIPMPKCEHTWGAPRTHGTFCTLCGVQQIPPPPATTTCRAVYQEGQHDWLGSSHGDYCVDCNILKNTGQHIDWVERNCGVK